MFAIPILLWFVIVAAIISSQVKKGKNYISKGGRSGTGASSDASARLAALANKAEKLSEKLEQEGNYVRDIGVKTASARPAANSSGSYAKKTVRTVSGSASRSKKDSGANSENLSFHSLMDEKKSGLSFCDDRNNDWLAKQLREEERILHRGSSIDLGASHAVSCEADEIKRAHVKVHGKY